MERTFFFIQDGDDRLLELEDKFSPLGLLLNRLIDEQYKKKHLKLINFELNTEKTYKLHPKSERFRIHRYGSVLSYCDVFELQAFLLLDDPTQREFLWRRAHEMLLESCKKFSDPELQVASNYAYERGLAIDLNPDYVLVGADIVVYNMPVRADLWVHFFPDKLLMESRLVLQKNNINVYEQQIHENEIGIGFFLEMYKKIEVDSKNRIVIKGHRDGDLPVKISIDQALLVN